MKLWTRNPFASVSLLGLLVVVGAALWPHVDQSALTDTGRTVAQIIGALVTALGPSLLPLARRSTDGR